MTTFHIRLSDPSCFRVNCEDIHIVSCGWSFRTLQAARVKLFPPQALLRRLDQRLQTLTGGARDLPARQQTLRGAIDWSYNLLDAHEQTLFARLGVFVGGCTLEAAEAVCNADRMLGVDLLDGLQSLLDQS